MYKYFMNVNIHVMTMKYVDVNIHNGIDIITIKSVNVTKIYLSITL